MRCRLRVTSITRIKKGIIVYLARNGLSLRDISSNLEVTLERETMNYQSVSWYLRAARCVSGNPLPHFGELEPQLDDCDEATLLGLAEQPFVSSRQLARLTHPPKTMVDRRLTQSLGFQVRHLPLVRHFVSDGQQLDRVRLSRELLSVWECQ
jgi:hypothetical protein